MEVITIFLTSLMAVIGTGGIIAEEEVAKAIRDRVTDVETLAVRIDNRPIHRLLGGKIDRLSIATRGLLLIPEVRIDLLEIETDPIDIPDFAVGEEIISRRILSQPIQLGMRLILKEDDLNEALRSQVVKSYLETRIPQSRNYQLISVEVKLNEDNRLEINLELYSKPKEETMNIIVNFGLAVKQGHQLEIIEPVATINERRVSPRFLDRYIQNNLEDLNLQRLDSEGIISRVLHLEVDEDSLSIVTFIRLEELPEIEISKREKGN